MKFVELAKSLKEKISPIYNLVGEDAFLIKQAILNIKSVCIQNLEEFNFIKLDQEKLKADELNVQLSTLPIGNDYRMIVINNTTADICKFISNYDFTSSSTILVSINAKNIKDAVEVDCDKLDRADIQKYILNTLYKADISIEENALNLLIDLSNGKISKIVNELNKIIAYAIDEKVLTIDIVKNLVSKSQEFVIYMLTTAIDNKDLVAFQQMFVEMSKTQSVADIFSYLGSYLRRMQYLCVNKGDEKLTEILRIKPYAIKISRQNIKKNGIKYYINLYQKYVELDYKIKSGQISVKNALFELVF